MRGAVPIIVGLDGRAFLGAEHRQHLRALDEAEEVVVMPGVAANRLAHRLERLDLAVDREHLLDEGAAEMEQPHLEWAFVLGTQAGSGLVEELPHVRLQPNTFGRLPAAGGARLDEDTVADLTGPCETL